MLEDKLEQDIKTAMLAGESDRVTTLRGLKATLLNVKVATGKRDTGLNDSEVTTAFAKEAKKRQESAELYAQGGSQERADAELREKAMIEAYLPAKISDEELSQIVDNVIKESSANDMSSMGQIIGQVKSKVGATADGGAIAKLVKEKLL